MSRTGVTVFELEKRIRILEEEVRTMKEVVVSLSILSKSIVNYTDTKEKVGAFDFQQEGYCASCHTVVPQILMDFHNHIRHGI